MSAKFVPYLPAIFFIELQEKSPNKKKQNKNEVRGLVICRLGNFWL